MSIGCAGFLTSASSHVLSTISETAICCWYILTKAVIRLLRETRRRCISNVAITYPCLHVYRIQQRRLSVSTTRRRARARRQAAYLFVLFAYHVFVVEIRHVDVIRRRRSIRCIVTSLIGSTRRTFGFASTRRRAVPFVVSRLKQ